MYMAERGCAMKQRVKEQEQTKTETKGCHHFWVIEVANGPTSTGKCKYCSERKVFYNAFPTFNPLRKNNPLTFPELQKVRVHKESHS
jgi:hypothetical protein